MELDFNCPQKNILGPYTELVSIDLAMCIILITCFDFAKDVQ